MHDTDDPLRQKWVGAENASLVCADRKGLEYHRVRTNATNPAFVPLLTVLITALPVSAHLSHCVTRC